ncbi:MAG TPA: type II secretion system F family protein [Gemmataceae bacterium]|jgi:type II secretory pathway component PulF|nr:type II secretion system F family protein [Gemmataceae bacterium]
MPPSLSALADWCRTTRHQLAAGVAVTKMLDRAAVSGPADVRDMSARLLAAAKAGQPLSDAFDAERLPSTFVPLFRVGEQMGRLPEILTALEEDLREQDRFRRQIRAQTLMPRIQFFAAIAIIAGLIWALGAIAGNNRSPITVFGLAGTWGALIFLACTLGPVLVGRFVLKRVFADPIRRGKFDVFFRRLPIVGPCMEALTVQRFARALGCTLDSGLPIAEAVKLGFDASPSLRPYAGNVIRALKQGLSLSDAIAECPLPADFVAILDSAEHAGSVPEAMRHQAKLWGELAGERLTLAARVVSGIVWLCMATFIITCIFQIASNYIAAIGG